jgi:SPP1 gp7 family putative phage head morphogenesis protein
MRRTVDAPVPQPPARMRKLARERFLAGRKAETQYGIRLRQVAKHIGDMVRGIAPQGELFDLSDASRIVDMLRRYAEILEPWARVVAARMVADVSAKDAAAWNRHGREIGRALKREIQGAPTGAVMRKALEEQVHYITSIPRDAAERVHKLTTEAIVSGRRAEDIAKEIMASGEVSRSKANLIARTEVSRTATALTQARAEYVGSEGYQWATADDGDVRPSHKAMRGKFVRWDSPPTLDKMVGHAGQLPNCRCYCVVSLPD